MTPTVGRLRVTPDVSVGTERAEACYEKRGVAVARHRTVDRVGGA